MYRTNNREEDKRQRRREEDRDKEEDKEQADRISLQALHALLPHLIEEALPLVEVGGNLQAVLQQLLASWVDVGAEGALSLFFYHTFTPTSPMTSGYKMGSTQMPTHDIPHIAFAQSVQRSVASCLHLNRGTFAGDECFSVLGL